eukprot:scaffold107003_cov40-Attheya_sp.AAC.4
MLEDEKLLLAQDKKRDFDLLEFIQMIPALSDRLTKSINSLFTYIGLGNILNSIWRRITRLLVKLGTIGEVTAV